MEKGFKNIGYHLTGNPEEADHRFHYSDETAAMLSKFHQMVVRANPKVLPKLRKAIKKYPRVPALVNHLSTYYSQTGNYEKAHHISALLLEKFPDYLIARINLANFAIIEEDYEKVPEILGEALDIKDLYPERNVFHYNEFIPFNSAVVRYLIATKQRDALLSRLPMLQDVLEEDHPLLQLIDEELFAEFEDIDFEDLNRYQAQEYDTSLETSEKIKFQHPEINELSSANLKDAPSVYPEILKLPRKTLIEDLKTLLWHSVTHYYFWVFVYEEKEAESDFYLHTLLLLGELKAESALPMFLDILRQGEEFLDFWYGDILTEEWWRFIYPLAQNQLPVLVDFIKTPNVYTFSRMAVVNVLLKISLEQAARKEEVVLHLIDIMEYFIKNRKDTTNIYDEFFGEVFIYEIAELRDPRLYDLSVKFFNYGMVEGELEGGLEGLKEEYAEKPTLSSRFKPNKDAVSAALRISKEWS